MRTTSSGTCMCHKLQHEIDRYEIQSVQCEHLVVAMHVVKRGKDLWKKLTMWFCHQILHPNTSSANMPLQHSNSE